MKKLGVVLLSVGLLPCAALAQGTFRVHFDQNTYTVLPNDTFTVEVLMEPVPSSGLFSFGIKAAFEQVKARVESAAAIVVPPPLDYNGVAGPGAIRLVEGGTVGVKGTVDFFIAPLESYDGSTLATITLRNLAATPGESYTLGLDLFRTLGPTESVFVDGAGTSLDNQIQFGAAIVTVVPEPGPVLFWLLGCCGCVCGRAARARGASRLTSAST